MTISRNQPLTTDDIARLVPPALARGPSEGEASNFGAVFERKKLVVSTLEYASLRDGLQQQGLIVESARKARDIAGSSTCRCSG
jgi:hypothetical protein